MYALTAHSGAVEGLFKTCSPTCLKFNIICSIVMCRCGFWLVKSSPVLYWDLWALSELFVPWEVNTFLCWLVLDWALLTQKNEWIPAKHLADNVPGLHLCTYSTGADGFLVQPRPLGLCSASADWTLVEREAQVMNLSFENSFIVPVLSV